MVSFISKFLFTATVTAPTFLSLGLIGVIKDSTNYFQLWDDMLENKIFPTSFEWWGINISFGFMLICLIGIKIFLYRKSNKHKEGKTIQVKSYSNLSLNSAEQIISSIIPWLTIFADKLDFMVLFVCINEDMPKSIFYYDDGKFYFQVFNKRNMLQRKMVLQFECGNIFAKMNNSAFIVEDKIHALYEEGKLYFQSYTVANQIFSLIDFVTEATNAEIESFGEIDGINVNTESIKHIANIKTRRLIKLLSNTDNISAFMRKAPRTKTSLLNKYGVNAQINENKELVLPTNNVADLNRVLEFLNEDIFRGVITDRLYRSNSKKKDNH